MLFTSISTQTSLFNAPALAPACPSLVAAYAHYISAGGLLSIIDFKFNLCVNLEILMLAGNVYYYAPATQTYIFEIALY